jgi:hypothetical protein
VCVKLFFFNRNRPITPRGKEEESEDIDDSEISNLIIVTQSPMKARPRTRSKPEEEGELPHSHELNHDDMKKINHGLYLYEQELRGTGNSEDQEVCIHACPCPLKAHRADHSRHMGCCLCVCVVTRTPTASQSLAACMP